MKIKLLILIFLSTTFSSQSIFVLYPDADLGNTEKLNSTDVETIFYLFQEGFNKYSKATIIENSDKNKCLTKECALSLAQSFGANKIVRSRIRVLGSKIIFTGIILDIDNEEEFTSRVTAINVEDMENASFRLAKSLVRKNSIDESADVDNIIEEDTVADKRRESLYKVGFNLGYLIPFGGEGYYYYDNDDLRQFSKTILQFGWTNFWELKDNKFVLGEVFLNLANSPGGGLEINMNKYSSKNDFSPFYGGGIGWYFNTLTTKPSTEYETDFRHGVALTGQLGATFLRTYNMNIFCRLKYHALFTTQEGNIDNGISFNVGIVTKLNPNKSLMAGRGSDRVEYRFPLLELLLGLK
jgi:hypothetical protein